MLLAGLQSFFGRVYVFALEGVMASGGAENMYYKDLRNRPPKTKFSF